MQIRLIIQLQQDLNLKGLFKQFLLVKKFRLKISLEMFRKQRD